MLDHIHLRGDHAAVQAFVEQQLGIGGQRCPGRKGAHLLAGGDGLTLGVQIAAYLAGAGFTVLAEQRLQLVQMIGGRTEVAEVLAADLGAFDGRRHLLAVIGMETVALDHRRSCPQTVEDTLENPPGGAGAGAAGAGDGDDGVAYGHQATRSKSRSKTAWPSRSPRCSKRVTGRSSGRGA